MLKHIWLLFTDKESIWCKWIHSTFLKNTNFWFSTKPTCCSWSWKKILDLRNDFQANFKWAVGDGSSISFWYDFWHPKGPLYKMFSNRNIYDSRIPRNTTLKEFFSNTWQQSYVLDTFRSWPELISLVTERRDRFTWQEASSGVFSTASAWEYIRARGPRVPWCSFVWDRHIAPKHGFLLWIISLNRLPTQEFLLNHRRISEGWCAFCQARPDSTDHLFFECGITQSLALFWASNCNLSWHNGTCHENFRWTAQVTSGNSFHHRIARFSFAALCHLFWIERNNILFRNRSLYIPAMRTHLVKAVRDKGLSLKMVDDHPHNRSVQCKWGISASLFDRSV